MIEHTAVRNQEGSQGQDHGLESTSPVHILMKKDADIDLAVALHMDPKENAVVVDRGAEENPIGLKDQDQRVEQEGHDQDYISAPIVEAVKDPVIELIADLVKEKGVKVEIKKK